MNEIVKSCSLFSDLNDHEIDMISASAQKKSFNSGDVIFSQGAPRKYFFIIISGKVDIVKLENEASKSIIIIDEGEFLSENSLLDNQPHGSSAFAKSDVSVIRFEKDTLKHLFETNFIIAGKVYPKLAISLTHRLNKLNAKTYHLKSQTTAGSFRVEHDLLGDLNIPDDVYYGVQTSRALDNFNISGIDLSNFPNFIISFAYVKKACAFSNYKLGYLTQEIHDAIAKACDEILDGGFHSEFIVDMVQGGAGTSTNMNANEVIANRASEILGHKKGTYYVHPNNHVNLSQSTNDAYPTSIRLATLYSIPPILNQIKMLKEALKIKSDEFSDVIKMGRTQLQDAVPMTLGQEFSAFAETLSEEIDRLSDIEKLFKEVNLGGTAIGTGINADPDFGQIATDSLSDLTGFNFRLAPNLIEATPDTGAFITFSSTLKRTAVKLSKICNDLRLLSSGPRTGFNEINLPAMQPGSSIMPGKVNPVIPEVVNQVAFQVIGNDLTVTIASEAGQLQLNVMEPIIVFNIFQSIKMLTNAMHTLTNKCITGITANKDHCAQLVNNSIGLVTALNPFIGYENATKIAKDALESSRSVLDIAIERKLLTKEEIETILLPENMTQPRKMKKA